MAINYDQRKLKTNADAGAPYQAFNAEYDSVRFDNDLGGYVNANGELYPYKTNAVDSNNRGAYEKGRETFGTRSGVGIQPVAEGRFYDGAGDFYDSQNIQEYYQTKYDNALNAGNTVQQAQYKAGLGDYDGTNDNYGDYYSNKDIYDSLFKSENSTITDYYKQDQETADTINGILYPYDPYTDYRLGLPNYLTDGGRSRVSSNPQKQRALDYLNSARESTRTAGRKGFQKSTVGAIITFLTAAAGGAYGAGEAASAGASGAATGAAPAVAGAAPVATGGGLFAGQGGLLGNLGNSLANTAVNSAIQSGLTSAISGGNPIKGALTGAISGGLANQLNGFDFGFGETGNAALSGALKGGLSSTLSGGNPLIGAATGGLVSGAGSVFRNGFDFGGTGGGASDFTFGGADGGSNGFQLPPGYSNEDSGNFDFSNSINNPLSGSGGNVGLFDDLFNEDANFDFTNSTSPNLFDQLTSGDNGGFSFTNFLGGDQPLDLGGSFDSNNPASFLDQGFPGATSSDDSINSFLDQYFRQNGQTLDLSNSGGPDVQQQGAGLSAGNTIQSLLRRLLGGAGGAGGSGGLAGLLSGNGGNFGQTLGNLTSGVLSNQQKQAIEGARDQAVNLADPFRQQRPQYQQQLSQLLANPGSISSSPAFQGIYDLGLEAVNRNASAKGQLNSGNRLAALSDYGQKTASQYYFPQAALLSGLAGANAGNPAAAGQFQLSGTAAANNLSNQRAQGFIGGLTGYNGVDSGTDINGSSVLLQALSALGNRGN